MLDRIYLDVYGNDVTANYYVKALNELSGERAYEFLDSAVKYLAEDKRMKDRLCYLFGDVYLSTLMDDMDSTRMRMREVLDSLLLLNHHVKDLKWLKDWLWVCGDPKERYALFKQNQNYEPSLGSPLDKLDQVAYEHYDIRLNAGSNIGYGALRSVPFIGFDDWDDSDYCVDDNVDFIYPEGDLDKLNQRVYQDYKYIYGLKDICIRYLLFNEEKENVIAKVVAREIGEDDRKLIGVEIKVGDKAYKFHNRSEEFFEAYSEIQVTENAHKAKFKIYNFSRIEVADALREIEDFCKSRNIRLPKREG